MMLMLFPLTDRYAMLNAISRRSRAPHFFFYFSLGKSLFRPREREPLSQSKVKERLVYRYFRGRREASSLILRHFFSLDFSHASRLMPPHVSEGLRLSLCLQISLS